MECDFNVLLSRIPSSNFRRLFPVNCSKFTYSMKLLDKPQALSASLLLSSRVKFSSCASVTVTQPNYTRNLALTDLITAKIPKNLSSPYWHDWSRDKPRTNEVMIGKEVLKRYSGMLRECASIGSINQGKAVHGMVIKSLIEPDLHLWVSLINFYAKCRSLVLARKVFDEMCERDVVSWTALIAGYVNEGCGNDAVWLYSEMRKENILPNEYALATVLKACSLCLDVELGKQVHVEAIKAGLLTDLSVGSALVDLYAKCGMIGKEVLKRYSGMLRECASIGSLNQGKAVHGMVIKSLIEPDLHLWVSLINFYAKCRSLVLARKVFDEMCERDVVSWTALIAGYVNEGCGNDAVCLYLEMRKENILPNEYALATVLKACSLCLDVELGKQVHVEAIKAGLLTDLFVGSALVDLYAKCGVVEFAERVFFELPEKNNVSWNVLLNGYAQSGAEKEVLKLFCRMTESEMNFNKFTLSTVVKCVANLGFLREGRVLHSLAIRSGCNIDEFLGCTLIDMYSKCGAISDALKVFNAVKDPDVVSWSAMIAGLDQQGRSEVAVDLFHRMRRAGVRPNQYTLASVVSAGTNIGDLRFGQSIHSCVFKYGLQFDNSVGNALITMYMKGGLVRNGIRVFESMIVRDLVSWNALLSGFHDFEKGDEGFRIFCKMLTEGLMPNMYTFVSVLRSCTTLFNVYFGKQVHAHIIKNSLDTNDFVGTALIDMYVKTRCVEDADVAFHRLTNRDVFTWTVIISGLAQTEQAEKAVKYLGQMLREGIKPNEFTLASGLSGCSGMAMLGNGQQLHSLTVKSGHHSDVFVASALVDMYGKCGCLEDAEALFKGLFLRDTVSWNIIISAYSQNGQGKKALEAFKMMLIEGIVPDDVTFIGILAACSYMGLVEEGKKFFDSMSKEYGITPSIEHHACMIDILGRAGRFDEVEVFIEEMKLAPYSLIWETVLGACKLHGNVDLGKQAAEKLFELEPEMDSSYILLSNIFAAKGKWDEVRNIRTMMSTQGVKKEPGCSWIEVDGHVNVFTSNDSSHPKTREVYAKLEELGQKLISTGYMPKTETVLHNISDKEKKEHLYYHSERLALAFALISTNPVKPIRIFKNLRICEDCHDVMKLISVITNRDIVIRDIKRFHHFKGGTCSCQDRW